LNLFPHFPGREGDVLQAVRVHVRSIRHLSLLIS
jgi:hypothetical protein